MIQNQHFNRKPANPLGEAEILIRRNLVDWLCSVGESVKVSPQCIHKAVVFLDVIMAENTIAESDLQPLGLVCLLLAGKLTEKDRQVGEIMSLLQKKINSHGNHLRKYEMQVLTLLHYDLQCVTPMDFLQFFASQGILFSNDKIFSSSGYKFPNGKIASSLRQFMDFFADMCLQEYSFLSIDSYHLAAAIIAASRKALKVENLWTTELVLLTGLQYSEIVVAVEQIFKHYHTIFPTSNISRKEDVASPKTARLSNQSRNANGLTCGTIRYV